MSVNTKALLGIFALSFLPATDVRGAEIIVPSGVRTVDGNGTGTAPTSPTRVQYLYDASFFEGGSKKEISRLSWRPDGTAGVFTAKDSNVTIKLSTLASDSLGTRFSGNVGTNQVEVFQGPVSMNADDTTNPRKFSLAVEFQKPYVFDPNVGNLLVDVTFSGFDRSWMVDNHEFTDGKTRLIVDDPNAPNATRTWNLLAPMEFTVTPVPEPSSSSVLLPAALLIGLALRKRKRTAQLREACPIPLA